METKSIKNRIAEAMQVFSARNTALQIGTLAFRTGKRPLEVCLITSRGGGRWIIPKGWPEPGLSHTEIAAKEAWEEAGLTGSVHPDLYASYETSKSIEPGTDLPVRMDIYLLANPNQATNFPELGQRKVKWLPIERAVERVEDHGLKKVLSKLGTEGVPI